MYIVTKIVNNMCKYKQLYLYKNNKFTYLIYNDDFSTTKSVN